jgi:hypothetical protein
LGTLGVILRHIIQLSIFTRRGRDVEMVMEDALENPKSRIKLTHICGFRSMTPAHLVFQNRTGFKNKKQLQMYLQVSLTFSIGN